MIKNVEYNIKNYFIYDQLILNITNSIVKNEIEKNEIKTKELIFFCNEKKYLLCYRNNKHQSLPQIEFAINNYQENRKKNTPKNFTNNMMEIDAIMFNGGLDDKADDLFNKEDNQKKFNDLVKIVYINLYKKTPYEFFKDLHHRHFCSQELSKAIEELEYPRRFQN
jgi:hypothetical protein